MFQSNNIYKKNYCKLGKINNIPFKTPLAEKKLALPETQASRVNIFKKVRPFCGTHIKCINITKKVRPLLMCFKKQCPSSASSECEE